MSDTDRLLGKMDAFIEFERREHSAIITRLDTIEEKVDKLREWRWKVIGGAIGISFVIGVGFQIITLMGDK